MGIPVEATIAIGMASVFILMVFGNPIWALVIGGALLMAARLIVRSDYNMFKILFLFGRTKASAPNKGVWGGSSFSPLPVAGVKRKGFRSEERRVGKEWVSTCRSRWRPYH